MIHIKGDNDAALRVTMQLELGKFPLSSYSPKYTIEIVEQPVACPVVDGIDCELERFIVSQLAENTPSGQVLIKRAGGVQSDSYVHITCPPDDTERAALATAILRAFLMITSRPSPTARKKWFR